MYQCSKKLVKYNEYSCFDHSHFAVYSMFTFNVCWGSLGTSIFGNSSSAANNTRSKLPSRLSFRFLEAMKQLIRLLWSILRCRRVTDVMHESFLMVCMNCVSDKCDTREVMTFLWHFQISTEYLPKSNWVYWSCFLINRLEILHWHTLTCLFFGNVNIFLVV